MERAETRFGTTDVPPREASEADVWEGRGRPGLRHRRGEGSGPHGWGCVSFHPKCHRTRVGPGGSPWGGHMHVCAETHTQPQKHHKTSTRGPKILPRVGNEREAKEGEPDAQKTHPKPLTPSNGGAKPSTGTRSRPTHERQRPWIRGKTRDGPDAAHSRSSGRVSLEIRSKDGKKTRRANGFFFKARVAVFI